MNELIPDCPLAPKPFALSLSKGRSWFGKLTTNGVVRSISPNGQSGLISKRRRCASNDALLVTALLFFSGSAGAGYAMTARDVQMLPSFCHQLSADNYEANAQAYRVAGSFPAGMPHGHHYCHGLKSIARATAQSANKGARQEELQAAVGEFRYVLGHTEVSPEYYSYLAMVKADLGRVYDRLGKVADSSREFMEAIRLKPDYVAAYIGLIDFYRKLGSREDALKTASEGLTRSPESKTLQRRYRELGGKLPYPAPINGEPKTASPAELPASNTAAPGNGNDTTVAAPPVAPSQMDDQKQPQEAKPQESKIGSPTNPWCRFCPPPELQ
ncbi:MAG: tetratricopeptide repeat protein [Gammaproteobacteria bacterium]